MAGQRVIYSYGGLKPPAELLRLISHGEAAGVIFFSQNVSSSAQLATVVTELERADASPQNPVREPLLLMTDQEGGLVRRIPGAPLLSEAQIGESPDPATAAANAGTSGGLNLRGIGLNVNLAPVLDVYRQPGDFDDQFQRSYSMNPTVVGELGADFITAQQRVGVAATAKHFPGLGAATQPENTDNRPVTLNLPLATIRDVDELPYQAAIAAGVRLVMVSWAVYPALDPGRPAGLSPTIVGGELRQRLGFKGVTITDALEAEPEPAGGRGRDGPHPLLGPERQRGRAGDDRAGERLPRRPAAQGGVHRRAGPGAEPAGQPGWLTGPPACAQVITLLAPAGAGG
jgi:beta-N-acetylhexosaminidase